MRNASRAATKEACFRSAQGVVDMANPRNSAWSREGRQRAWVTTRLPARKANDYMEADGRTTRGSGRHRARNKHRASSNLYWYLSAVAVTSLAFFAAYVSHMTLQNLRTLSVELREAHGPQQGTLGDGRSQQLASITPGTGHDNDASPSTDASPGETHEEGKEESSASEIRTLSTQRDNQSSSTEVSQRGPLGIILRHVVKTALLCLYSIMNMVVNSFRFAALIFEAVRSVARGITAIGNTVLVIASVLFTAVSVSLVILGLHLIILLLSAAFPEGHFHASLHSVFGRGIVVLFQFLQWFPYASLLLSSFLLAVYRTVVQASTRDTVSRVLGVLLAYIASLNIADIFSIPLADPTWGVSLSTLSYFTALSTFLTVDSLTKWSTRPFMLGLLTIYTLYLIANPFVAAALQRPERG